ncbi:MAG: HesA/MoeB/ThiF family protein [Candidatus Acetothermia bacterium]
MSGKEDVFRAERYERQMNLLGESGQKALRESTATVVGLGGLGSPAATYLTAAGFGRLVLVDYDEVTPSNLNRQVLHGSDDVDRKKTRSAREKLKELDPEIELETCELELEKDNVEELPETDLVLGAVDNFRVRYLLNEYAVREKIAYIHGAVKGFNGQLMTVIPGKTACLRCTFPEGAPEREGIQVLGPTAGVVGTMMANEAIKYVTGVGQTEEELLLLNLKENKFEPVGVSRVPDCPVCGDL